MRLASLHIYPVKALGGIDRAAATVTDRGLDGDRRMVVVDETGRFLTQRTHPKMALVATALDERTLTLRAPGQPPLAVPRAPTGGDAREVTVWGDRIAGRTVGDEAARYLGAFLGLRCALVYMPEETLRPSPEAHPPRSPVSFADAFPYLVCTTASLEELARRGAPAPMDRFRPNLVVEGAEPFEEDRWSSLRIGDVTLHLVKPCGRCTVITVDQATAAVGREPLATLATFRRRGGEVCFGWNAVAEGRGILRVGDAVIATARAGG